MEFDGRLAYVAIPGNDPGKRIGIVRYLETGYYPCDFDSQGNTIEQVKEHVNLLNERLEIPKNVADAMLYGSMFGWHVPAARPAVEYWEKPA